MFCEFLPENSLEEETPHTLLMEEVKEGQNYELIVTNASGLFRCHFIHELMTGRCRIKWLDLESFIFMLQHHKERSVISS